MAWFHQPALLLYAARSGGPFYVYGISELVRHLGPKELPGVDYLFLYWLARATSLITAQD